MYTYTALCVVQSSMQLQQKDWNKYVHFQWERMYVKVTVTAMVRTTELNQLRYINHLSNTQCINKIYYLHVSHEKPLHCS